MTALDIKTPRREDGTIIWGEGFADVVKELRIGGLSFSEIAEEVGASERTIRGKCSQLGLSQNSITLPKISIQKSNLVAFKEPIKPDHTPSPVEIIPGSRAARLADQIREDGWTLAKTRMARARLYRPRIQADEHVKAQASYLTELEREDAELDIEVLEPEEGVIYVVTLPVDRIVATVSKLCNANPNDVLSRRRFNYLVMPRQIAMHLCRLYTQRTLPELGRLFHRDHSTIIHADRKISGMIEGGDAEIRSIVRNAEMELLPANYKGPRAIPLTAEQEGEG